MNKTLSKLFILFFFSMLFGQCFSDGSSGPNNLEPIPDTIPPISEPIHETTNINNVNLFVENSGSMGGYYTKGSEYRNNLMEIVTELKTNPNFASSFTSNIIYGSENNIKHTKIDLYKKIKDSDRSLWKQKSSNVHFLLSSIFNLTEPNDISILVSDGILDIKGDIQNVKTDIKNEIAGALSKNFAIKILVFNSKFGAKYYYNQNGPSSFPGSKMIMNSRPYYMMIIGKPELIRDFESEMKNYLKSDDQLEMGFEVLSEYQLADCYKSNTRSFKVSNSSKLTINTDKLKDENTFGILTNLSFLSTNFQSKTFLEENLTIKINEEVTNASFKVFNLANDAESEWKSKFYRKKIDTSKFSHLIGVTLKDIECDKITSMSIGLNQDLKGWLENWNSESDLKIDLDYNKTYALEHLVNGIVQAFHSNPELDQIELCNFSINTSCN